MGFSDKLKAAEKLAREGGSLLVGIDGLDLGDIRCKPEQPQKRTFTATLPEIERTHSWISYGDKNDPKSWKERCVDAINWGIEQCRRDEEFTVLNAGVGPIDDEGFIALLTPGPWHAVPQPDGKWFVTTVAKSTHFGGNVSGVSKSKIIAIVNNEADARIIADVPLLIEMLNQKKGS